MVVKPMPRPKEFLIELLEASRPQATEVRVICEDPMPEVVKAYAKQAETINQNLIKSGLPPMTAAALGLVVEYVENGKKYREVLITSIVDARGSVLEWSNADTLQFRALLTSLNPGSPFSTRYEPPGK